MILLSRLKKRVSLTSCRYWLRLGFLSCKKILRYGLIQKPSFLSDGSANIWELQLIGKLLCLSRQVLEIVSDNSEYRTITEKTGADSIIDLH